MATGSGVNAANNEARTARAVACGPYRSNVRLSLAADAADEPRPTRAGTNIGLACSTSLSGCFSAGSIGLASMAGLIAITAAKIAKSHFFLELLTTMLDAMLWFRLDEGRCRRLSVQLQHFALQTEPRATSARSCSEARSLLHFFVRSSRLRSMG